ncbi:helix-turn-helix domain-containing protein [Mesorhizobium sp. M0478]|uniref:helix-turn-helix domain-containing protein n=1 Tax=Mesorhizobium sp. M0478 TaxID=2956947 RepID=UPI0033399FDF
MSDIAEKWGDEVAERGFAQIPNYLLLLNRFLDVESRLTPVELLVLIQLVGAWWQKENKPFPSMATLAVRIGVSERQVQRAVARLLKEGLIARVKRRQKGIIASNAYDLSPLADFLGKVAKAFPNEFPRNVRRSRPKTLFVGDNSGNPRAIEDSVGTEDVTLDDIDDDGNLIPAAQRRRQF